MRWVHVRDATGRDCNWVLVPSSGRMVPGRAGSWDKYQQFPLHLLVMAMSCSKVSLKICTSLFRCFLLAQSAAGAHEGDCGKDLGIAHVYLMSMANCHASCLRKVSTILDQLEEGIYWFLWVPCLAHLFKIVF
jgi:hypothetical protein